MLKIVAGPVYVASPQHINSQLYLLRCIKKKKDRKPGALHIYYGTTMVGCVCMLCDAPVRFQGKKKFWKEERRLAHFLRYLEGCMYMPVPLSRKKKFFWKEARRLAHFLRYL